jgi:anti-sigma factor RsiW
VAKPSAKPFDDVDLMQYVDDELDPEHAAELAEYLQSEEGAEARDKLRALDQMSDLLSSYLELEADSVEPRLDAMWEVIEQRTRVTDSAPAPIEKPARAAESRGLWSTIMRFFDGYRGHILTGALAAGAAAAIILALRPPKQVIIERPVAVQTQAPRVPEGAPGTATQPKPELQMVVDEPSAPTVEELDVSDGSAMIFMMPGESEDDVSATVIYVDFNNVEGPL